MLILNLSRFPDNTLLKSNFIYTVSLFFPLNKITRWNCKFSDPEYDLENLGFSNGN